MTFTNSSVNNSVAVQDNCPACNRQAYDVVGPASQGSSTVVKGLEFIQPPFEARRCRHCHLVFKSHIAAPHVLSEYYDCVDFQKWHIDGLFPTEKDVVQLLRELPAESNVLDFGCSTGRLLSRVVDRHRCFGFEINSEAASIAASRGLTMISSVNLESESCEFDAIVMIDVFEHLTEPLTVMRKLADKLRRGGRLIVCTGNSDVSAVRGEPALFWYLELIEHLCMLNPPHAKYLAAELGMQLNRSIATCHYDATWKLRIEQKIYSLAFEAFHRSKSRWLPAILGLIPRLNRVRIWTKRAIWNSTADHLILVFEKP